MAKLAMNVGLCILLATSLAVLVFTGNVFPVSAALTSCVLGILACTVVSFHERGGPVRQKLDKAVGKLLMKVVRARSQRLQQPVIWSHSPGKRKLYHFEVDKLIQLILRDFVRDWHSQFSQDEHFPSECKHLLETFAGHIEDRMNQVRTQQLLCDVVAVTVRHLSALNDIGALAVNEGGRPGDQTQAILISHQSSVEHFLKLQNGPTHPALVTKETEVRYIRACLDCACEVAIPDTFKRCSAARYFMRELLATRLIQPVLDLLGNPDFLMAAIIAIFRKSPLERLQAIRLEMERENEEFLNKRRSKHKTLPIASEQSTSSEGTLVPTPSAQERGLASGALPEEEYGERTSSDAIDGDVIISSCQVYENTESKPFVGYVVNFPASVLRPGALKELGLSPGKETGTLQALTRFSDYDTLQSELKGNPVTAEAADRLSFPDKVSVSSILSRIPLIKNAQSESSFMESRRKQLEKFLNELWSQPLLQKSSALEQFLKTGVLRQQWHLNAVGAATAVDGVHSRKRSAGGVGAEAATASPLRPKRQSQEVMSAFLNAHLPMAYRTSSASSEPSPTGTAADKHALLRSSTPAETPVEELTASAVLVRNHLQLNRMQSLVVSASGTMPGDSTAADKPTQTRSVPNGSTSSEREDSSRQGEEFSPKEFLNFTHEALRFRFPSGSSESGPEELQTEGQLTNSLFCLANEAARPVCSGLWLCRERVQRALLAVMGGALDRTLLALLSEVTEDDESWARVFYHLRHTLWPEGVLNLSPWQSLSYPEKRRLRQQALTEIKNFLPNVFPYLVGSDNYTAVLQHGLDSLENPTLNRHLLFHIVDVLMLHFIPELGSEALVAAVNKDRKAP